MTLIEGTWRTARLTRIGRLVDEGHLMETARVQKEAAALCALRDLVSDGEYMRMAGEVQRGMREIRIEEGMIITSLSPGA
jgi:hypothetical protein